MVSKKSIENKNYFICDECGFVYEEKVIAEKCEAWCKEHYTCNIGITQNSVKLD